MDSPNAENSSETERSTEFREGKDEDTERVFKKPDKIVPCPRCRSSDTKFCYFNNYNVNQPRHFCKNCQRYWTAGGTMRNVPVGAGRRKNKHLASHFRQILASTGNATQVNGLETTYSGQSQLLPCDESLSGKVLRFGPDQVPVSDSVETILTLGDPKAFAEMKPVENADREQDTPYRSAMTQSDDYRSKVNENVAQSEQVCLRGSGNEPARSHPLHCYSSPPLVLSWNPGWKNAAHPAANSQNFQRFCVSNSGALNQVQWFPTQVLAIPGSCPSTIPLGFVPVSYWNCMPVWASQTGDVSLAAGSFSCMSSSSTANNNGYSGNKFPIPGKHCRDSELTDREQSEMYASAPKTLKLDDPDEALRCPIQTTFGIKLDNEDLVVKDSSVRKKFTHKIEGKDNACSSPVLESNPAAFSRSHAFQVSS